MIKLLEKIIPNNNQRVLKRLHSNVNAINDLEAKVEKIKLSDFPAKTIALREKYENGANLDDLLIEGFAYVRQAAKLSLGLRHFDVQLLGGIILNQGKIAEMKTGEGKTLVATLAAYLNSLTSKGVQIVTVNDYLASRDSEWMGEVYKALGLSVGCIIPSLNDQQRKEAYNCDVTYGTNSEFGFDFLRDNLKPSVDRMVMRDFNYAIVDEVDSILIDEARTPLIISGPSEDNPQLYSIIDTIVSQLGDKDYELDEKQKNIFLTDEGINNVETKLEKANFLKNQGLYHADNIPLLHNISQALRARKFFSKDVDYIVKDGRVLLIDEFTGRVMEGRRLAEGLHQAIEAKERVGIQRENQTLASITYQNFFRQYPKLAGMTGTAKTEEDEFIDIYGLEVVEIPCHKPMIRKDHEDDIYRTSRQKFDAVIKAIIETHETGQPLLIGTISIERSEELSKQLKKAKINHRVLNAKNHQTEAEIISEAGSYKAITIATNMAGRGTDIQLGGNLENRLNLASQDKADEIRKIHIEEKKKVISLGGLAIIGTERHESRRIDNQLRGRSGRQGDPGFSKFYVSLEDDLMRVFGAEKMGSTLAKLGLKEGESLTHPWLSKAIERAQKKVESRNFEIRKQLIKYDDVMNDQRMVIFEIRKEFMSLIDVSEKIDEMLTEVTGSIVDSYLPPKANRSLWQIDSLTTEIHDLLGRNFDIAQFCSKEGIGNNEVFEKIKSEYNGIIDEKKKKYSDKLMLSAQKHILLLILDQNWKDHLNQMDILKRGIGLRAYGQKDPLNEYKKEAFASFQNMIFNFKKQFLSLAARLEINLNPKQATQNTKTNDVNDDLSRLTDSRKISRNAACPCGSGKKYKHCHGRIV